jgi:Rps23 Pro-64 3,4-dihydroxylase Tpa1-like proline 4-hydroxylase
MTVFFDYQLGKKLNFSYNNNTPYPNIVLDNFINSGTAIKCFHELKNYNNWYTNEDNDYIKDNQVNKYFTPGYPEDLDDIKVSCPTVYEVLHYFNSDIFLKFLEDLTGIKNLIADPTFEGGGCHKVCSGGKLSLHVDYNLNEKEHFRVLNLLLYLNPDWKEEWEGALELWDSKQKKLSQKIFPFFNRVVIFSLSDNSIHGHPIPLKCPKNIERYSLALYYFTKTPNQDFYERRWAEWKHF